MRPGRVELLGSAAQIGWYTSSKAKYGQETDSEQGEIVLETAGRKANGATAGPRISNRHSGWFWCRDLGAALVVSSYSDERGTEVTIQREIERTCVFASSVSKNGRRGFIRPVLKHGPRSPACTRVPEL
eukprot:3942009-Rhodomonas_salina.2